LAEYRLITELTTS